MLRRNPDEAGFDVLPAVDVRGGRVVRLVGGDFDRETVYGDDPVAVATSFASAGARWIHLVDLDAARDPAARQSELIAAVVAGVGERSQVEVAGGIRDERAAASALAAGAARVVVGTAALRDPDFAARLVAAHGPERVAVALDVRAGLAFGHAWRLYSPGRGAAQALAALADAGVTTFEVTAIDRDGSLAGPDLGLYERLIALGRGRVIASGGIASLADLRAVRARGCAGAIVGRALYEGRLALADALAVGAGGED
jgi:phosphoribosylformimino-5-aminoimidazole carboxamide ribotide isomerase